jgi:hypothetical protein
MFLYENLLPNVDVGPILRKLRKHPPSSLDEVDPKFFCVYNKAKHGEKLWRDLNLSHLDPKVHHQIYAFIQKYWSVFDDNGVFVPVKNYIYVIDTSNDPPINIKKILFGPKETPIMRSAIAALEKVGQIHQNTDGCWSFKALLAANLYQEHIQNINKFVWHFCVNYIPLSSVTRIIAYLILHCDLAKIEEFGLGVLYWLFDSLIGCHQLAVALASQVKVAF